jgi:hypothetical protein
VYWWLHAIWLGSPVSISPSLSSPRFRQYPPDYRSRRALIQDLRSALGQMSVLEQYLTFARSLCHNCDPDKESSVRHKPQTHEELDLKVHVKSASENISVVEPQPPTGQIPSRGWRYGTRRTRLSSHVQITVMSSPPSSVATTSIRHKDRTTGRIFTVPPRLMTGESANLSAMASSTSASVTGTTLLASYPI